MNTQVKFLHKYTVVLFLVCLGAAAHLANTKTFLVGLTVAAGLWMAISNIAIHRQATERSGAWSPVSIIFSVFFAFVLVMGGFDIDPVGTLLILLWFGLTMGGYTFMERMLRQAENERGENEGRGGFVTARAFLMFIYVLFLFSAMRYAWTAWGDQLIFPNFPPQWR